MSRAFSLYDAISFDRTLPQADLDLFAKVSGDANPLHVDADAAAAGPYGRPIAHGMLLYAIVWGAIHQALPDAVPRRVTLTWAAPVLVDDTVTVAITPQDTNGGIRFRVVRTDGTVCCEGQTRLGPQDDALIVTDDMAVGTPTVDTAPQPRIGARVRVDRKFTPTDIAGFAVVAGLDRADFGFLPEPLLGALFSQLIGMKLPGRGALYKKQQLEFSFATPLYHPLTAAVEVAAIDAPSGLVTLRTLATLADATILTDGRALVAPAPPAKV